LHGTEDYEVGLEIDYRGKKIKNMYCTCPYFQDHRQCKHIIALALYLTLYINNINIKQLMRNKDAAVIYKIIDAFTTLDVDINVDKIQDILNKIKKDGSTNYKLVSLLSLRDTNVEIKNIKESLNYLLSNNSITIKDDVIRTTNSNKYFENIEEVLCPLYNDYEDNYDEEYDWEDEDDTQGVSLSKENIFDEINKDGVDIEFLGSLIQDKSYGSNEFDDSRYCNDWYFSDGKLKMNYFDTEDSEDEEDYMSLPVYKVSAEAWGYFVRNNVSNDDKDYLLELLIHSRYKDFFEYFKCASKSLRDKFHDFEENYYVGKAIEFCKEKKIQYNFKRRF